MAASIQTVLCIPCLDSVLELGTTSLETENLPLVEQIQYFLSNKIMAPPPEFPSNASMQETTSAATQSGTPTTHFSSTASLTQPSSYQPAVGNSIQFPSRTGLITSEDLNQPELNSPLAVPEQTWRSASMSNLRNGMFIQQTEQACQEKDISKRMAVADSDVLATEWRLARSDLHTQSLLMNSRYRSMSDTPSTSISGNEDVSQVSTSPDHPVSQVATSQHGDHASPSNSSSSARRSSPSQEPQKPDLSLNNGTSLQHLRSPGGGPDCNIEQALSLMLSGGQNPYTDEHWRPLDFTSNTPETLRRVAVQEGSDQDVALQTCKFSNIRTREEQMNRSPQGQFKRWKNNRIVATMPNIHDDRSPNQFVLRRCFQMLKNLPEVPGVVTQLKDAGSIQDCESIQTSLPDQRLEPESNLRINHHGLAEQQQVQTESLHAVTGGVAPRSVRNISAARGVPAGHDEAAVNHMLAERRRRVKQKENFTVLRKLVPIISKADKASILGDAILYLKDLQSKIQELEHSNQESKQRYQELEIRYKEIEQQNKELKGNRFMSSAISQPCP